MRVIPKRPVEPNRIAEFQLKKPIAIPSAVAFRFRVTINGVDMYADLKTSKRRATIKVVYIFNNLQVAGEYCASYNNDTQLFSLRESKNGRLSGGHPLYSFTTKEPFAPTNYPITDCL